MRRAIVTADDFGLSLGVNEAVERAYRDGILTTASLMIAGPAAADAIRRAKAMPGLRVGLHVVVVEGASVRPGAVRGLVDPAGNFPHDQFGVSVKYYFSPKARRQLFSEIRSQFSAYKRTGLALDHANAHKHMQLHPTVGRYIIEAGREFKLPALRIPNEPPGPVRRSGTGVGLGGRAMATWCGGLRRRAVKAGLRVNDNCFGIAWSGHMTADRLLRLVPNLPEGLNEIYFHPAARRDGALPDLMPEYEHEAELATLLDPALRAAFAEAAVERTTYTPA